MSRSLKDEVKALGYTVEEIDAIEFRIALRLSLENWKSFMMQEEGFVFDPHDDQYLRLPTGRVILIPRDIYENDILIQVDDW